MQAEPKKRGRPAKVKEAAQEAPPTEEIKQDTQPAIEPVFLRPEPEASEPVEPFEAFIHRIQRAHVHRDVFVVEAQHPEASGSELFQGVFSGFRLTQGPVFVKYSDGSTS